MNETINLRIKKLRKALDLTQQAFADRLGMKQNTIATYEMGKTTPSKPTIKSICREFGVNETWLRNGDGEMFIKRTANDEISALVDLALCDEPGNIRYRFLSALAAMSEEELQAAARFALALAK